MADLAGRVDVALLPISGWGVTLPDDHLNPLTAAKALVGLRPSVAIPIHYGVYYPPGMLALWRGRDVGPPRAFARYAAKLAPDVEVRDRPARREHGHRRSLTPARAGPRRAPCCPRRGLRCGRPADTHG